MTLGGYVPVASRIHELDPRLKLIAVPTVLLMVFLADTFAQLAVTTSFIIIIAAACRCGSRIWWSGIRRFVWMFLVVFFMHVLLTREGRLMMMLGRELPITWDGLQAATVFCLKLAEAVTVSLILTATTRPTDLAKAVARVTSPFRCLGVNPEETGIVLMMALRFIPVYHLELQAIVEAQKSRGIDFSSRNIIDRAANFIAVLAPALTAAMRRADAMAVTMSIRGFQPGSPRTSFRPMILSTDDYVAVAVITAFVLGTIAVSG
jgi:energy-coupling factor transport system permease protein